MKNKHFPRKCVGDRPDPRQFVGGLRGAGHSDDPRRQRVEIHHYDPAREIACKALGLAYGQVYVGGLGEHVRSHEVNFAGDGRGFIPRAQVKAELAERAWHDAEQSE